jgi:N-acylglucosamine-6-phosphate 2-epimerase
MIPDWLQTLRGGLIVSCQAKVGEPMRDPYIMAAVAQSVVQGGAAAVRANLPDHIRAMRAVIDVPIFGIYKRDYPDAEVYITPTLAEAEAIVQAGCDVLTIEATQRRRPNGQSLADFMHEIKTHFTLPVMADISTHEEGLVAAALGADLLATTLSGYTPYSPQQEAPDFRLIETLARAVDVPVIAEGRISTPEEARRAFDCGAFAVVVGSMITRPEHITAQFLRGLRA